MATIQEYYNARQSSLRQCEKYQENIDNLFKAMTPVRRKAFEKYVEQRSIERADAELKKAWPQ